MNLIVFLDGGAALSSLIGLIALGFVYYSRPYRDSAFVLAGLLFLELVFHSFNFLQWRFTKADWGIFDEIGDLVNVGLPLMWAFLLYALLQEEYETSLKRSEMRSRELAEDLTESNRNLVAANERLREVDKIRTSFLASVSHELRTPLASIQGYTEIVLYGIHGDVNDSQKRALETILRNNARLDRLIKNLLEITRIETGRFKIAPRHIDLRKPLWHVEESFRPTAAKLLKSITCLVPPDPMVALADEEFVIQAVSNLVDNALRYAEREIAIRLARCDDRTIAIEVEDDGTVIAPEKRVVIFERFHRDDRDESGGHLGVGLAIVKEVAAAHGGDARVFPRSDSRSGNVFRWTIPAPAPALS